MAKRGYKLQEFVAHSANVNCIKIGNKTARHFITGGDDEIVNLWSIGNSTSISSLSGHTSPIESVAFDSNEALVAAGASSGVVKLWDLQEAKVVRTLNGHRSYCTAVEFHPFGEFFASGSMDTNLKIWDIRKKGCIQTYKGHKRAISTIKFTPDGRWVVSGGLDNVVKIWDLTAGKILHEFKLHEGHIKSMDFHPLEFLLATGSSDKTVKFWDLETFELIGSTRPEATGVRSITFHPDGRTLFCGLDNTLKVYSWEPVICHDSVDLGWSALGDLCISDGNLLGCSYFQNSIGVWASDVSHIEPYTHVESKSDLVERVEIPKRSFLPLDDDTKDIKNIYVDTAGVTHKQRLSSKKLDIEELSTSVESILKGGLNTPTNKNFQRKLFGDDVAKDSDSYPNKLPKENLAVANGRTRTRSLVEKFEKQEKLDTDESNKDEFAPQVSPNKDNMLIKTHNLCLEIPKSKTKVSPMQRSVSRSIVPEKVRLSPMLVTRRSRASSHVERTKTSPLSVLVTRNDTFAHVKTEKDKDSPLMEEDPETTGRSNDDFAEEFMIDHHLILTTLRSRLTKLQVVRRFWERNDMRGAINALQKLPDHAVHADVISVMLGNIESLTLDLFSSLLPLLLGLLDSETERHVNVSLDMLLKLVAVFGPIVTSTISAPPAVGVDLHAEKRLESCNACHVQLQKIHKTLPNVIRRGGLLARIAQELNLILQQT